MLSNRSVRRHLVLAVIVALSVSSPTLAIQKKEKDKPAPRGTPVLWREPVDIASRDLFLGPGGASMRPDLRGVTFVKEEKGGYSTKYRVKDGAGRVWVAKIGKEAQSETAAVRLLWAVGYPTEINYLVPRLTIEGKGTFENVRLEARPESVDRLDEWKWSDNPFVGTKELQGLIVLMALLNNWDIKDANNKVFHTRGELRYVISDLGATFGRVKSGAPIVWRIRRNRNDPADYSEDPFVEDVKRGNVLLFYKGKRQDLFDDIRVEEARWIGGWLARLSDRQLADAFRAANYTPGEVKLLVGAVRARINELTSLPAGGLANRR
ncbi:MAG TPA: hypothetical protein VF064_19995 [Pyrinomonadaceae bacterium]